MMYYVNWVLTNAQLELIAADVSVVDYNYGKEKKKRNKGEFDNTPASKESVRKANEEWLEKYGDKEGAGSGLSVSDILGNVPKADVGIKIE